MRILLRDGSGAVHLKFLRSDADRHGNMRLYFRRNGRSIRLREEIGTQAFLEEYRAAMTASSAPAVSTPAHAVRGSLRWLIAEYFGSAEFKQLDPETQGMRRRHLESFALEHGVKRFETIGPKHIRALRDRKADTPHGADNWLKSVKALFKWAVGAEHLESNPARDVSKINAPSDGFHTWTVSEILQFMRRHPADTRAGLAFALLFYLGPRRSDVVTLGRQMETADGYLRFVETKGRRRKRKVTEVKIQPELRAVLELHRSDHLTYLVTERGAPFTVAGFGNWFKDQCVAAGLPHCSAHGVRKGGATIAADNGATEYDLMAMYGWANPSQAAVYTKRANRKRLAARAADLVSVRGSESERDCSTPGSGTNRGGGK